MNIRFLEPVRNELDDAFDWYEMEQWVFLGTQYRLQLFGFDGGN